jgi:hypothetical protein
MAKSVVGYALRASSSAFAYLRFSCPMAMASAAQPAMNLPPMIILRLFAKGRELVENMTVLGERSIGVGARFGWGRLDGFSATLARGDGGPNAVVPTVTVEQPSSHIWRARWDQRAFELPAKREICP